MWDCKRREMGKKIWTKRFVRPNLAVIQFICWCNLLFLPFFFFFNVLWFGEKKIEYLFFSKGIKHFAIRGLELKNLTPSHKRGNPGEGIRITESGMFMEQFSFLLIMPPPPLCVYSPFWRRWASKKYKFAFFFLFIMLKNMQFEASKSHKHAPVKINHC